MYLLISNAVVLPHCGCCRRFNICIAVFVNDKWIPLEIDIVFQDFVGEAPIHKAARSGSLECVQVLLIAGAKPQ